MEKTIPGRHEVEDTDRRWYDSDILIFVGHDDVEDIMKEELIWKTNIEDEALFEVKVA